MTIDKRWYLRGLAAAAAIVLTACGGGGEATDRQTGTASSEPRKRALAALSVQQPVQAAVTLPAPGEGFEPMPFVNYETAHVHPMDQTPDGRLLLAVNTAAATLMVFDLSSGTPVLKAQVPVGLEPVTVRVRSNTEAWVVNQLSDTISRVDLQHYRVVQQVDTADEPADVVFAGSRGLAFVTASQAKTLQVFDPAATSAPLQTLRIQGEEPRSLAVSPDGKKVYAAIFKSGNGTTTVAGGKQVLGANRVKDVLALPDTPYGGVRVPPNDGAAFKPALNPANPKPPAVSMIVRKGEDGRWRDGNRTDWTAFVSGARAADSNRVPGWDLVDRDLAIIDTDNFGVQYRPGVLNINMALAVHPTSGDVTLVGTDATNEIRYEPNLNGTFIRVKLARFAGAGGLSSLDLNPHLDYRSASVPEALRQQSIGDPRAIEWQPDGRFAWVAGMGSNNVVILDETGRRVGRVDVGQGPTGLRIDAQRARVYVLNRFSASIDTLDLHARTRIATTGYFDPTPAVVREGRPLLYDTHVGSGLGQASCASCHVDGRTDRLAWDLGDPSGPVVSRQSVDGRQWNFHPMKGPLKTQTLVDIIGAVSLHHRGDKDNLHGFAAAFRQLQGTQADATAEQITRMERFLDTIHFGPNPHRGIDNTLPTTFPVTDAVGSVLQHGDANAALPEFMRDCAQCHRGARGRGDTGGPNQVHTEEPAAAEALGGYYTRMGFHPESRDGSTSGFGTRQDATDAALILLNVNNANMHALFMSWEGTKPGITGLARDSHAGVGRQVSWAANAGNDSVRRLIAIADSGNVGLIAKGQVGGIERGYTYVGSGWFQGDIVGDQATLALLTNRMSGTDRLSFMLVPRGSEQRLGIDADLDGVLDGQDARPSEADAARPWSGCANEGQVCTINGSAVLRYGSDNHWVYGVFSGAVTCGNSLMGDPIVGVVKRCELTSLDTRAPLPRTDLTPVSPDQGLRITADDRYRVFLNGVEVASGTDWTRSRWVPLRLQPGDVLAVEAADVHDVAVGMMAEVRAHGRVYATGRDWKVSASPPDGWASADLDDSQWPAATEFGGYGASPWVLPVLDMPANTAARWIWSAPGLADRRVVFRYRVPDPDGVRIAADNSYRLFVNGVLRGQGNNWMQSQFHAAALKPGDVLAVEVDNAGGPGGLLAEVSRGERKDATTATAWRVSTSAPAGWAAVDFDDRAWTLPTDAGVYGSAPWSRRVSGMRADSPARWLWLPTPAAPKAYFRFVVPSTSGIDVHRFLAPQSRHFFTTTRSEGVQAGFQSEGVGFGLLGEARAGAVALYRCRADAHFLSVDPRCEGRIVEGVLGFIYQQPTVGAVPLHRLYHPVAQHMLTASESERASLTPSAGWQYEGVLGYVFPAAR